MIESGTFDLDAPGGLYWLRTGLPVWLLIAAGSKKASAAGNFLGRALARRSEG
jgi:hypothetical protein